jgi:hypothetical protein
VNKYHDGSQIRTDVGSLCKRCLRNIGISTLGPASCAPTRPWPLRPAGIRASPRPPSLRSESTKVGPDTSQAWSVVFGNSILDGRGVWSVTKKNPIVLFERHCQATEKSEAIACVRRCWSSWLTKWWTKKNNRKKWRAEEEERHKGLLTKKKLYIRPSSWQQPEHRCEQLGIYLLLYVDI